MTAPPGDDPGRKQDAGDGRAASNRVGRLFRDAAPDVVSALLARYGARQLEAIEDAFQEAMIRAIEVWPFAGVPDRPRAWLYVVARNRLIDGMRRDRRRLSREYKAAREERSVGASVFSPEDRLRLIFFCCHPVLSERGRIALTLQLAGGFRTPQIARALLARPAAVEKLLQRAKAGLRTAGAAFLLPGSAQMAPRLRDVLRCVYLIFNEGLNAHAGDRQHSEQLCAEALRLTLTLLASELSASEAAGEAQALAALICFHSSRLPARIRLRETVEVAGARGEREDDCGFPAAGDLVLLQNQDRSLWDRELIERGFVWLRESARGDKQSRYHLEAGIAACHALAPSFAATDWSRIAELYDVLLRLQGGPAGAPVAALNRAAALLYADGAHAAQKALDELESAPEALRSLRDYHLLPATRAAVCERLGQTKAARDYNRRAIELARLEPERRLLRRRLRALQSANPGGETKVFLR